MLNENFFVSSLVKMHTNVFAKIIEHVELKFGCRQAVTEFFHLPYYKLIRRCLLFERIGYFTCFLLLV